jgi:hypothetical protein
VPVVGSVIAVPPVKVTVAPAPAPVSTNGRPKLRACPFCSNVPVKLSVPLCVTLPLSVLLPFKSPSAAPLVPVAANAAVPTVPPASVVSDDAVMPEASVPPVSVLAGATTALPAVTVRRPSAPTVKDGMLVDEPTEPAVTPVDTKPLLPSELLVTFDRLVTDMTPAFVNAASPDIATPAAMFPALPTKKLALGKAFDGGVNPSAVVTSLDAIAAAVGAPLVPMPVMNV